MIFIECLTEAISADLPYNRPLKAEIRGSNPLRATNNHRPTGVCLLGPGPCYHLGRQTGPFRRHSQLEHTRP